MNDLELLGEYVQKGSEAAFSELVRRHIDWVQGSALRQVGRRQMAEDVTQGVFIALAQQGRKLSARERPLAPWLLRVVRYACISALRAEKRQKQHEQGAAAMRAEVEKSLTEGQWEQMAPVLDELVGKLGKKDQEAVLLRFYQRKSLAEVGEELGVSEAAAQKRVERAVEKLRGMFRRRGLAVGSGMVLAAGLEAYTTAPASAALVAATTQSALAAVQSGAVGGQLLAIAEGAMKMMRWRRAKVLVGVCVGVMLVSGVGIAIAAAMAAERATTSAGVASLTTGSVLDSQVRMPEGQNVIWVTTFYSRVTSRDGKRTWVDVEDRQKAYRAPGLYRETFANKQGQVTQIAITDANQKRALSLYPQTNSATLTEAAVAMEDPRGPFAWCDRELAGKDLKFVEMRHVDVRDVNVFRHAFWDAPNGRNWSYDFWLDAKTKELVAVNVPGADIYDRDNDPDRNNAAEARRGGTKSLGYVDHKIEVGAEVDASLFSLELPEGYALTTVSRPQVTEKDMVDYLRVLAEYNAATFPDQVIPFDISSDRVNHVWAKPRAQWTRVEEQFVLTRQRFMNMGLNGMPVAHFVEDHVVAGSFKYSGKGVKLGAKDGIVCWYRVNGETGYHVIYGDLSVKQVREENLPKDGAGER